MNDGAANLQIHRSGFASQLCVITHRTTFRMWQATIEVFLRQKVMGSNVDSKRLQKSADMIQLFVAPIHMLYLQMVPQPHLVWSVPDDVFLI